MNLVRKSQDASLKGGVLMRGVKIASARVKKVMQRFVRVGDKQPRLVNDDQWRRAKVQTHALLPEAIARDHYHKRRWHSVDAGAGLYADCNSFQKVGIAGGGAGLAQAQAAFAHGVELPAVAVIVGGFFVAPSASGQKDKEQGDPHGVDGI